jgi:hypothetical protein
MSTDESIFLQVVESPAEVAEWLTAVLTFERLPGAEDGSGEVVMRASATTVDAWLGVLVDGNSYVSQEGEAAQAIDAYPIEIAISLKPEEVLRQEARLAFDKLVEVRPEVAMLLVHDLDVLVAAHLPDRGTEYFADKVSVDAPDQDKWRPWVRS